MWVGHDIGTLMGGGHYIMILYVESNHITILCGVSITSGFFIYTYMYMAQVPTALAGGCSELASFANAQAKE